MRRVFPLPGRCVVLVALLTAVTFAVNGFGEQKQTDQGKKDIGGIKKDPGLVQKPDLAPALPIPKQHKSPEADVGFGPLNTSKSVIPYIWKESLDLDRLLPEWVPVKDVNPATLEGIVVGPHITHEDFPATHYTHDFCFHVRPDVTPDKRFTNLLAILVDPKTKQEKVQSDIEVEWETGLAASNDGNLLAGANRKGDSGGFYSAGHKRRGTIWNWPTANDWVHVVGNWIWDRGHPPAHTEIHPPRLVAIRRDLPTLARPAAPGKEPPKTKETPKGLLKKELDKDTGKDKEPPKGKEPPKIAPVLATKVDIFASGDGGAIWNNRSGVPAFVQKVKMSDRDYTFLMEHPLPRPSPKAKLGFTEIKQAGDTFPGAATVEVFAEGSPAKKAPHVKITIPWNSRKAPDVALFARSLHLFWEEGHGVPDTYQHKALRVTLDKVQIHKVPDFGWFNDAEYRVFVDVAGHWLFLNEIPNVGNILDDGLGDTSDESWTIGRSFIVHVPMNKSFRVHAGGWEADGINDVFGHLMNQNDRSEKGKSFLRDHVFTRSVFLHGAEDDPIGEVNKMFNSGNKFGIGKHADKSKGGVVKAAIWSRQDTNPNDSYSLHYHIEELSAK